MAKEKEKKSYNQPLGAVQHLRARWHDYRAKGFYLITLVTEERTKAFGKLVGDSEVAAHIELNALGMEVQRCIDAIPDYYPETEIVDRVVMEDHCHICLHVKVDMKKHLGMMVRALKSVTTKFYLQQLDVKDGGCHLLNRDLSKGKLARIRHTDANIADSLVVGSMSAVSNPDVAFPLILVPPLWAEGYHDRIVARHGQIARQKAYIQRNPSRLWLKRHADRALAQVRDIRIPVNFEKAMRLKNSAEQWDMCRDVLHSQCSQHHDGTHYAETYVQMVQKFLRKNADTPLIKCRVCGNTDLLFSGRPLVHVRISRSVTETQFREEVERLLGMCEREGAVLVSPWRSWSEKELLKFVRMNGYEHVVIYGEAMSNVWKPQDGSICNHHQSTPSWWQPLPSTDSDIALVYEGRVLYLALWPDRPRGERASKPDCEIMNEVGLMLEE